MYVLPFAEASLADAVAIIQGGGIVAHPTETCYGLACDLSNPQAVRRLFALKDRPTHMPVSGLFPSVEDAQRFVAWSDEARALADAHLPGPLTIILPLRADAPRALLPSPEGGTTLGVRVSSNPLAAQLAFLCGFPISTTSANRHGEPNPYDAERILTTWPEGSGLNLVLDGGALPPTPPSTVIDLSGGAPQQRRAGSIHI